jgi:Uma2 family endonuclease
VILNDLEYILAAPERNSYHQGIADGKSQGAESIGRWAMSAIASKTRPKVGEPSWEVAYLFPAQGTWTEEEYLALPDNRLLELSNGFLEILPLPTMSHQMIIAFFYRALLAFTEPRQLGTVLFAGIKVRLWKGKIRQPDVVFMLAKHADRLGEEYWQGADLVMEVVSGTAKDRQRDLKTKFAEYARARIPEYWIVDPKEAQITVLRLKGKKHAVHGRYGRGMQARSALLKGFEVDVAAALAGK